MSGLEILRWAGVALWFVSALFWWNGLRHLKKSRTYANAREDEAIKMIQDMTESREKVQTELERIRRTGDVLIANHALLPDALGISPTLLYDDNGAIRMDALYRALGREVPTKQ